MLLKAYLNDLGLEIRPKNKWKKNWHQIVRLFFFLVSLIRRDNKYATQYVTCVGDTIYVPVQSYESYVNTPEKHEATLRHEAVHRRDYLSQPIFYSLSYIFSKKWRAYWERRAYTQNMIVEFEKTGDISTKTVSWIIKTFEGPDYLWMDREAFIKIIKIKEGIISGHYEGAYPDVR